MSRRSWTRRRPGTIAPPLGDRTATSQSAAGSAGIVYVQSPRSTSIWGGVSETRGSRALMVLPPAVASAQVATEEADHHYERHAPQGAAGGAREPLRERPDQVRHRARARRVDTGPVFGASSFSLGWKCSSRAMAHSAYASSGIALLAI